MSKALGPDDTVIHTNAERLTGPPAGGFIYLKIGSGATAEWVTATGVGLVDGDVCYTGVSRGQLETAKAGHAVNDEVAKPYQYTGCARGQFDTDPAPLATGQAVAPLGVFERCTRGDAGTTRAAHAKAAPIRVFATDDAFRQTAAHEFAHAVGVGPNNTHRANSIMQESIARGAFLGSGVFVSFLPASQDEIDAR